ncbi:malic enzyme-like NAD(P)-binding protein [Thiohalophilus sp.]|uniref:malic enzyme-like NAD(P)-binding protein n=1 Tax=Thiohalophilus sp. TaxID=3028392 RepID=UPI002ACDA787|nr:malic enzyme-like NAD(P)-binding protein [Thiohalophilus sp.]MDZ7803571.1 malic enzyme-like NAD(P)-binding protein [Thiohalophilus sp.]
MNDEKLSFAEQVLRYHAEPRPGKTATALTKPVATQHDLSLAYTPGVAVPVQAIAGDPQQAYRYTNKGNLVAVISNGSAVLGLGNVGALAGKPVMEGKAVLFKHFADVDVVDIEVDAESPRAFIDTVRRIAPSFGGINLEDIAAPDCFEIEQALKEQLDIPVFHDDQHGTAIIIAAGLLNALELTGRTLKEARIVCLGAGSAGIASMRLLHKLGADKRHITLVDRKGVIHSERRNINAHKREFARRTGRRTLAEALAGADVFIGVSGPDLVSPAMLQSMADNPIVFALSNPDPEITPANAHAARSDLIMATGRSDYPNQVNNVLGFPFIFRGALDVQASAINTEMQIAAVKALAQLAHEPVPESVLQAYGLTQLTFGRDYIIPKPFDPRLRAFVSQAVSQAARDSGVARDIRPGDSEVQ